MSIRKNHRLSRRHVLRGLGGAAIALPLLDAMRSDSAHAGPGDTPKRLIIMYTPNGTVPANFWPSGNGPDFTLSPILAPLAAHQQDLLILGGLDLMSSLKGPGDAHQKGTGSCLTGTPLLEGDFAGDGGQSAGWAGGISIDQEVANHIGQDTPFASLELGVAVQDPANVGARISYRGAGQPLPPENSPYAAYQRLFGDSISDPLAVERRAARRRAVLDAVGDEHRALRDKLGGEDREKLENHLTAVEEIRDRLDEGVISFGGECQPLQQGALLDPNLVSNMPFMGKLQMDLMAMAMACDITRVGTIMWTRSVANHVFSFVDPNIKEAHHSLAHKGDEDAPKVAQNTAINAWYAEQMAYLITRLKAIPEGDGTVFDNTVILWTNEQAKGNNHSRYDMPYVLAGSAGGYFNTGRYLTRPDQPQVPHNKLLVSLLHAMDIDADSFGDPEFDTGPLSGLT
ncbi:hypothetical protein DB30_02949 [Enhygromyxa salina]|uniref:Tat (Twin-arginine translocation) pathway signal sequence domain protein n=1 Tax=Enhygromyxa salina TaxID=215803 RepID=A0A0C1ZJL9_9BACT|nr:DUF1552 domain-containing protein [Enhygromyxa salina]KIG17674.1 hypothetical protein DB30_02949 [Enhygromyxa salina]